MRNLIVDLINRGERNRSAIACRVWQTHPACSSNVLTPLLAELLDEHGGSGAAEPRAELSTSRVGKPESQSNRITQESQRETTRKSECYTSGARAQKNTKEIYAEDLREGRPSTLEFVDYLRHAIEEQAGRAWRPGDPWESPLWHLVRLLKAHPEMANHTARQAFQAVEAGMRPWRTTTHRSHICDDWSRWLGVTREDAEAEFFGAWDKVRYLPGHTPLMNAAEQAERQPLALDKGIEDKRPDGYQRFISIAVWLQVGMGNRPVYLPVEELATLLSINPATISRYRRWGVEDGYLRETKRYEFHGKGKGGKATEFRANVGRWPDLANVLQEGTAEGFGER